MATVVERARRLFTVEEYDRMVEAGILTEKDHVELIEGEIVQMSPIGNPHAAAVASLTGLFVTLARGRAVVWVQSPARVGPRSKPQPDLALLRKRSYRDEGPGPDDILLLVEVADTSLAYDRAVKLPLYARAGVPEAWIADTRGRAIEIHRAPGGQGYRQTRRVARDGHVSPLAFPDVVLPVADVFA